MQGTAHLKHFRRKGMDRVVQRPLILFEVRVDYHDVRSSQSGSEIDTFSAAIVDDGDLDWTPDMVKRELLEALEETSPPASTEWPESAQSQITRYFMKHFSRTAWKNASLGLYSGPGESVEDFTRRCLEELSEERRNAVSQIRDVFLHRFLEAEQRVMAQIREQAWDESRLDTRLSEIRDAFSEIRERFSRCFLSETWEPLAREDLTWKQLSDVEIQERLEALRDELVSQHNSAIDQVKRRLTEIEPHELTLNHGEIVVTPVGFLWE